MLSRDFSSRSALHTMYLTNELQVDFSAANLANGTRLNFCCSKAVHSGVSGQILTVKLGRFIQHFRLVIIHVCMKSDNER